MTTLIIRRSKTGSRYAALVIASKYSGLVEESKSAIKQDSFKAKLKNWLETKTTGKGDHATSEDIDLAILEVAESLDLYGSTEKNKKEWGEYLGDGFIQHKGTGVKYVMGYCEMIVLEEGLAGKKSQSRTGKTLAKKYARKLLPLSKWKMIQVDGSELVIGSDQAWTKWRELKQELGCE